MRPQHQVVVLLDGVPVPGLLLKWRTDRTEAFVTYEVGGRVQTAWVKAELLSAAPGDADGSGDTAAPSDTGEQPALG